MVDTLYQPPKEIVKRSYVQSLDEYQRMYQESIQDKDLFFDRHAKELLSWDKIYSQISYGRFETNDMAWFLSGQLNACYNCVDRHAFMTPEKVAIYYEGDELNQTRSITYKELLREVCRIANYMISEHLQKGDTIAIYMPMIPEAIFVMLACARLGFVHSVVFGGFSVESLMNRIQDAECRLLFTTDEGYRGGKTIYLKNIADQAVNSCSSVQRMIVLQRNMENPLVMNNSTRDVLWHQVIPQHRPYCPYEPMNSEDPLFLLYTSGSTGKPKGVMHTHAGYLLMAAMTVKYVFDIHPDWNDVFGCTADIGWITGHTYIVYGPLCVGATTLVFEGIPTYPDAGRFWNLVERYKITQFYTAPTAIRTLKKLGDEYVKKHNRSSLRILGSVGEPINPEAWLWYYYIVGEGRCAVVDTYWQTETGAIIMACLPGSVPTKPGSASLPFFGMEFDILHGETGQSLLNNSHSTQHQQLSEHDTIESSQGRLVIKSSWPSMARTLFKNHERFCSTYLQPYPGYYFTGDGSYRDQDGYFWILGRIDDVINVSGHRLGTAEIESAFATHTSCAEAAVIGAPDELTGQSIFAFVCLKQDHFESSELINSLRQHVRQVIGPIATPKTIVITPNLPKTRSGKVMRRLLRKIILNEHSLDQLGDISTLADSSIIATLIYLVQMNQSANLKL